MAAVLAAGCGRDDADGVATDEAAPPVHDHAIEWTFPSLDSGPAQDSSTLRMVEELRRIHTEATQNSIHYFHLNSQRVRDLRFVMASTGEVSHAMQMRYARELLNAGETRLAVEQVEALAADADGAFNSTTKPVYDLLSTAYLRLGEQQNCLEHPSADACILPLRGGGLHRIKTGSQKAVETVSEILKAYPRDLESQWLLNVAHMTLGQYPRQVPESFRIEGLEARSKPLVRRFSNRAPALGVDVMGMSGGVSVDDFNNDGFLDLFVTSYGLTEQARYFEADGKGGFIDKTAAAGLLGIVSGLNVIHADYDNDGYVDVFIPRGAWLSDYGTHPNSLLRNNGDGTFTDVTFESGVISYHPTQTAAWGDFNNDGLLDLFVGNETRAFAQSDISFYGAGSGGTHPCELFMNNGDGTFTDVAGKVGVDLEAFVKGAAWGDINNDGLLDLYVSTIGERNRLYLNRGGSTIADWRFDEIAGRAGVTEPRLSFPVWFWDYDHDGWEDILVLPYDVRRIDSPLADVAREYRGERTLTEKARLYRNNGNETFTDVTAAAGLDRAVLYAMGSNYGDLDNDGLLDFYVGTGSPDLRALIPNRMFLQRERGRFVDVTFDGGFGHLQKGHGVAFADFDRDGDQDVYINMGGAVEGDVAANTLFENPGSENAWITLVLEGRRSNRSAVGARIRITASDSSGESRHFYGTVSTGGSFGASSLQQEFGLGNALRIDTLRVTWPNRAQTTDTFVDLPIRAHLRIVEGSEPVALDRPPVRFAGGF